jgi:molybdopterin-guanine dinucleotide biosynthesis protein A
MNTAAGILAGGQARRFNGVAKGLLRDRNGKTIIERLESVIQQSGLADIVLLTNDPISYESSGIPILPDLRPGQGPLAAMETALEHFTATCDAVLFVPCDLPGLTTREIQPLLEAFQRSAAEAVVAKTTAGELQPLCVVLSVALRRKITQQLDAGRRSVIEFLQKQHIESVEFENTRSFCNINAPEDWRQWLFDNTV